MQKKSNTNFGLKVMIGVVAAAIFLSYTVNCVFAQTNPITPKSPIFLDNSTDKMQEFSTTAGYDVSDVDSSIVVLELVSSVISLVLAFVGVIFLVLVIYAGGLWMTAHGAEDQIEESKSIMIHAAGGIIVVLMAYSFVVFVMGYLWTSEVRLDVPEQTTSQ